MGRQEQEEQATLCSQIETYLNEDGPESEKLAQGAFGDVRLHRTCAPVAEAERLALGVATGHGDQSEHEKAQDEQDLEDREPELSFAKVSNTKQVLGAC